MSGSPTRSRLRLSPERLAELEAARITRRRRRAEQREARLALQRGQASVQAFEASRGERRVLARPATTAAQGRRATAQSVRRAGASAMAPPGSRRERPATTGGPTSSPPPTPAAEGREQLLVHAEIVADEAVASGRRGVELAALERARAAVEHPPSEGRPELGAAAESRARLAEATAAAERALDDHLDRLAERALVAAALARAIAVALPGFAPVPGSVDESPDGTLIFRAAASGGRELALAVCDDEQGALQVVYDPLAAGLDHADAGDPDGCKAELDALERVSAELGPLGISAGPSRRDLDPLAPKRARRSAAGSSSTRGAREGG